MRSCCFFLPLLLCVLAFVVWGCFGLALSPGWVSSLVLPSLSVAPLVPSGPVSVLLVLPPDIWSYLRRLDSCLHFSLWQQRLRPCVSSALHHATGVVQMLFFWPEPVAFRRVYST